MNKNNNNFMYHLFFLIMLNIIGIAPTSLFSMKPNHRELILTNNSDKSIIIKYLKPDHGFKGGHVITVKTETITPHSSIVINAFQKKGRIQIVYQYIKKNTLQKNLVYQCKKIENEKSIIFFTEDLNC